MKPDDIKEMLDTISNPDNVKEAHEEQKMGIRLFNTLLATIDPATLANWLYSKEWEDVLVPVRLSKGMSELLKSMDEAKAEYALDQCDGCKSKANCLILLRNPSELLLTYLTKLAFAQMIFEKGTPK